jgi:PqqD family protein of HPr-rel-A system
VRIEALGQFWAAYSPRSGETLIANDFSAAILEVLETGPMSVEALTAQLVDDAGGADNDVREGIATGLPLLVDAGLIEFVSPPPDRGIIG